MYIYAPAAWIWGWMWGFVKGRLVMVYVDKYVCSCLYACSDTCTGKAGAQLTRTQKLTAATKHAQTHGYIDA